jgi:transposase
MASLQKVRVRGRTYWRIVESRRVRGKPRPVPLLHLGTADALLDRLLRADAGRLRLRSFQHGDVAALKAAADRLGVVALIDRHVGRKRRAASIGTTVLLAALNRALAPRSKRAWAAWAEGTSLAQLFPGVPIANLTSQFFWDQMDAVSLEALEAIEAELTQRVVSTLGIKLDTLFYDTTNFFTYIASTNARPKLAKRGRSKQRRSDLRLFSLSLLVSRDGQIPLCSRLYEGNTVDVRSFPDSLTHIRERLEALSLSLEELTLVYDRGNLSRDNQRRIDRSPFGYVAAMTPSHHADLLAIPAVDYVPLPKTSRLAGLPVLRLRREIWGVERTVVLFISERLRAGQIRGLEQHLRKRLTELAEWKDMLRKPRSGPRSPEAAKRRIEGLLSGQHLKKVLRVAYHPKRKGSDRLEYGIDEDARNHLIQEVFGKRFLVTDRHDWSDEEIVLAYRGQSRVEEAFRQLKDEHHLAVRPQYHWTDQKIHVHTFMCLLAFLLARMVEHQARTLGCRESLSGLLDRLGRVRLAMVLRASGPKGGRPRCHWQLEESNPETLSLFRQLVPDQTPFVYTADRV